MTSRVVVPLRVLIVVLLLLALAAQALVPLAATEAATTTPELSYLQVPYAVAGIATIGCGQVVLVAIWPLLTRVRRGAIFDVAAFRWVGVMIGAGVVATTLSLLLTAHVLLVVQQGPVTVPLVLLGGCAAVAAFTLLMVVMRALLRSAVAMHDELAEVI